MSLLMWSGANTEQEKSQPLLNRTSHDSENKSTTLTHPEHKAGHANSATPCQTQTQVEEMTMWQMVEKERDEDHNT